MIHESIQVCLNPKFLPIDFILGFFWKGSKTNIVSVIDCSYLRFRYILELLEVALSSWRAGDFLSQILVSKFSPYEDLSSLYLSKNALLSERERGAHFKWHKCIAIGIVAGRVFVEHKCRSWGWTKRWRWTLTW